jgi:hypothetical protein
MISKHKRAHYAALLGLVLSLAPALTLAKSNQADYFGYTAFQLELLAAVNADAWTQHRAAVNRATALRELGIDLGDPPGKHYAGRVSVDGALWSYSVTRGRIDYWRGSDGDVRTIDASRLLAVANARQQGDAKLHPGLVVLITFAGYVACETAHHLSNMSCAAACPCGMLSNSHSCVPGLATTQCVCQPCPIQPVPPPNWPPNGGGGWNGGGFGGWSPIGWQGFGGAFQASGIFIPPWMQP